MSTPEEDAAIQWLQDAPVRSAKALDMIQSGSNGGTPVPPTPDSDFQTALQNAVDSNSVLTLTGDVTLEAPVAIKIKDSFQGWFGLDGAMHKINSRVSGQPALRFYMDGSVPAGVCARSMFVGNLKFQGAGNEDALLQIDVARPDKWLVNPELRTIYCEGSGNVGIRLMGDLFEGNLYGVSTMNCKGDGVHLANLEGGVMSAMRWFGGTQRQNGGHGILYEGYDGPHDMRLFGLYFCENGKNGINALCGLELVDACGFENNHGGAAIYAENFCYLRKCTGSTYGPQPWLLQGYVVGEFSLDTCSVAGYNGGAPKIAQLTGGGTVRLVGTDPALCSISGPRVVTGP